MSTDRHPTRFTEANALLIVQGGDPDLARDVLRTMLPRELYDLHDACEALAALCSEEMNSR